MTTFNIFHTTRVRIGVRDAPHIWGAGDIRDAGERRLFGGLARSEPFVTPHIWGTGEMSTEISTTYLGCWRNKQLKSRRIYVALGHDELKTLRRIKMLTFVESTMSLISTSTPIANRYCVITAHEILKVIHIYISHTSQTHWRFPLPMTMCFILCYAIFIVTKTIWLTMCRSTTRC